MNKRRASLPFIFTTIFLDSLGVGVLVPIMPDVIRRFGNDPVFVNQYFGYFISVYALVQFFSSPVQGALADRFGRRPVLLISLLGAGIDYLLMAFAPNLWILFFGRLISGLTCASMTVASSYIADISDDSNRSANFGMIGAGWGLGFIAGPILGGLLGSWGVMAPFLAAASLNLLNFAFGIFVLPESLPFERRRKVPWSEMNPFRSLSRVLKIERLLPLVAIYSLIMLAGQSHHSIWALYTEHKFGWSPFDVGLSLSFVGLAIAVVQGGLTRVIIPRLGESKALRLGLSLSFLSYMAFAFLTKGWMMYGVIVFTALGGISMPALQSLISRGVHSNEQGELQGTLMSIASMTAIIGPLLYTGLFAKFTAPGSSVQFPGVSYFAAGVIVLLAGLVLLISQKIMKPEKPS